MYLSGGGGSRHIRGFNIYLQEEAEEIRIKIWLKIRQWEGTRNSYHVLLNTKREKKKKEQQKSKRTDIEN